MSRSVALVLSTLMVLSVVTATAAAGAPAAPAAPDRPAPSVAGESGPGIGAAAADEPAAPPNASFVIEPGSPTAGETVTFDASASSDPDGEVVTYVWTVDDDRVAMGRHVEYTFESGGAHEVTLTVTDEGDRTDAASRTVLVEADESGEGGGEPVGDVAEGESIEGFETEKRDRGVEIPFLSGGVVPEEGLDPAVLETEREFVWTVVQFRTAPSGETIERLDELGYRQRAVLADDAYYAGMPRDAAEEVAALESVRAVADVDPEWKVPPRLDRRLGDVGEGERLPVTVLTFESTDRLAEEFGLAEVRERTYRGELTAADISELREREVVRWIEPRTDPTVDIAEGRRMVAAQRVALPGVDGSGVRVGVVDTGIDHDHPHFSGVNIVDSYDKIDDDGNPEANNFSWKDNDHGTHVAGTIAGSSLIGGRAHVGIATDATLVVARGLGYDQFGRVNSEGTDIISNSWSGGTGGQYSSSVKFTDKWARKHPQTLLVVSYGNWDAGNPSEQFAGSPSIAKNALTVGTLNDASKDIVDDPPAFANNIDNLNNVAWLNNLTQPKDGRRKPDINAPGAWITSPVPNGTTGRNVFSTPSGAYGKKTGSSMATPHVSGIAALYEDVYANRNPDANEIKAAIVATAGPVENPKPSERPEGHGAANAYNALYNSSYESASINYHGDLKPPASTANTHGFEVAEDAEKVVVSLSWLDPPGSPSSTDTLVNDLDLYVGPTSDPKRYSVTDRDNSLNVVEVDELSESETGTQWVVTVEPHDIWLGIGAGPPRQNYDGRIRVVTEEPTMEVSAPDRIVVEPHEIREQTFTFDVNATGAPVHGVRALVRNDTALDSCASSRAHAPAFVIGTRSEAYLPSWDERLCFEVPDPGGTTQNYTVDLFVNTTNAEGLSGPNGRNATREVIVEVRPRPDADRWEGAFDNDELDDAVNISDDSWSHQHLRCYGYGAFSGGRSAGSNCSTILTDPSFDADPDAGAGPVTAYESWNVTVPDLSLDETSDRDFFEFDLPETDTPKLPEPECGTQNVTIGGETKEVKTSGSLRITVVSTANSLGDDGVRAAGPATPINVYDEFGSEVPYGSATGTAHEVTRRIPCPRNNGLADFTVSFGEGPRRNMGTYRIEIDYGIDVTRTDDAASINREQTIDAAQAERMERYIVAGELIGGECAGLDCSIVKGHPIGPEVGEDPVCRRAICRDPTFVTIGGSGTFRISTVGHPDLRFELQDPTGEPIAASETTEEFTAAGFRGVLTDLGYGQWVTGLGTAGLVGLLNAPGAGVNAGVALDTTGGDDVVAARQQLTVEDLEPGTYRLVVEGPPGTYWLTEFDRPPVPEDGGEDEDGPAVRLEPATRSVRIDGTTTFDVQVTDVDGGVGSYELVVETDDAATARIVAAENRIGGTERVEPAEDGASVRVGAFAGDTNDTGTVTVATVTVAGVEPGTAGLSVAVESVADEAGEGYALTPATDLASVAVREEPRAPEVIDGTPANDFDGDGVYEDVNGDNDVTPGDATVLFNAVFEGNAAVRNNPEKFDANGDGEVTPGDANVLFARAF
ncbi:MAG: S8 family serine peptidase [Haloarculaceae archaeon]